MINVNLFYFVGKFVPIQPLPQLQISKQVLHKNIATSSTAAAATTLAATTLVSPQQSTTRIVRPGNKRPNKN